MPSQGLGRLMQKLVELIRTDGHKQLLQQALGHLMEGIHKNGIRRQIKFLIDVFGTDEAEQTVTQLIELDKEIEEISAGILYKGCQSDVISAVYDEHIKSAHDIVQKGLSGQLRFLVSCRGLERVKELLKSA